MKSNELALDLKIHQRRLDNRLVINRFDSISESIYSIDRSLWKYKFVHYFERRKYAIKKAVEDEREKLLSHIYIEKEITKWKRFLNSLKDFGACYLVLLGRRSLWRQKSWYVMILKLPIKLLMLLNRYTLLRIIKIRIGKDSILRDRAWVKSLKKKLRYLFNISEISGRTRIENLYLERRLTIKLSPELQQLKDDRLKLMKI